MAPKNTAVFIISPSARSHGRYRDWENKSKSKARTGVSFSFLTCEIQTSVWCDPWWKWRVQKKNFQSVIRHWYPLCYSLRVFVHFLRTFRHSLPFRRIEAFVNFCFINISTMYENYREVRHTFSIGSLLTKNFRFFCHNHCLHSLFPCPPETRSESSIGLTAEQIPKHLTAKRRHSRLIGLLERIAMNRYVPGSGTLCLSRGVCTLSANLAEYLFRVC